MPQSLLTQPLPVSDRKRGKADNSDLSIIYFGNDWSGENRTSSHHIAQILGERFKLLYIETPGMRAPAATKRDFRKLWLKLIAAAKPPRRVGEHMWVMTMPQIPFRRWSVVRKLNEVYGRFAVRNAIRKLQLRNAISWFVVPHPGALAGKLGENWTVYYCIDDYSGLPDVDQDEIRRLDNDLTRAADQVFVASQTLIEKKKEINPNTTYSPHGVDFAHFSQASNSDTSLPEQARKLSHPLIGFFGSISRWIDLSLIAELARARPDWTFLLIGFASVDIRELQQLKNVILAGTQPYRTLPNWAKAFDVAILPYKRLNQGAMNANPLKLREYLATGKPVVAVSTPEIDRFSHCIRIANTPDEFLRQIEEALASDSDSDRQRRMESVLEHTWEARADCVIETVRTEMAKRAKI